MKRLYILTCSAVILALAIFYAKGRHRDTLATTKGLAIPADWLGANDAPMTPEKDRRPADQTFLTFPEWYLVFSPEEQAQYFQHHTATHFPYRSHTEQIWDSYRIVTDQIRDHFPNNKGYHFMIRVIGSSATVEYMFKDWYETVVGRVTDPGVVATAEDRFNATYMQHYVDFIKDRPWYEFDFQKEWAALCRDNDLFGTHFLRKIERRYLLSSELLVKMAYGKLIGLGTQQIYEEALPTTAVILDKDSLAYLPRYDQFAATASKLAVEGHEFYEIAGNTSAILLTVLVPAGYERSFAPAKTIFIQKLPAAGKVKRLALAVPVSRLSEVLRTCATEKITVEHVFDY